MDGAAEGRGLTRVPLHSIWPSRNRFKLRGKAVLGPWSDRFAFLPVWGFAVIASSLFSAIILPEFVARTHVLVTLPWVAVVAVGFYYFWETSSADPGIIPRSYKAIPAMASLPREQVPDLFSHVLPAGAERLAGMYCLVCQIEPPPGSHHCRRCRNCVAGFDHHCVYLGTCIGAGNRRSFLKLTVVTALWIGYGCLGCVVVAVANMVQYGEISASSSFSKLMCSSGMVFWKIAAGMLAFVVMNATILPCGGWYASVARKILSCAAVLCALAAYTACSKAGWSNFLPMFGVCISAPLGLMMASFAWFNLSIAAAESTTTKWWANQTAMAGSGVQRMMARLVGQGRSRSSRHRSSHGSSALDVVEQQPLMDSGGGSSRASRAGSSGDAPLAGAGGNGRVGLDSARPRRQTCAECVRGLRRFFAHDSAPAGAMIRWSQLVPIVTASVDPGAGAPPAAVGPAAIAAAALQRMEQAPMSPLALPQALSSSERSTSRLRIDDCGAQATLSIDMETPLSRQSRATHESDMSGGTGALGHAGDGTHPLLRSSDLSFMDSAFDASMDFDSEHEDDDAGATRTRDRASSLSLRRTWVEEVKKTAAGSAGAGAV